MNGRTFARKRRERPAADGRSAASRLYDEPATSYSQIEDSSPMHRGTRVFHETFGEGRIIEIAGLGDKAKATVDFPKFGKKNLMLKFANLRVM